MTDSEMRNRPLHSSQPQDEYTQAKAARDEQADAANAAATPAASLAGQQTRAAEMAQSEKAQSDAAVARLQAPPASTVSKATNLQARLAKAQAAPAAQTKSAGIGQAAEPPP